MTGRPGFILLYSVVLVLVLSILAAGMLGVAARESQIARTHVRLVQARATAESAVRVASAGAQGWQDSVGTGETWTWVPTVAAGGTTERPAEVTVTRLDNTLYLVRADARWASAGAAEKGGAVTRTAALLRLLDPELALASFPAAVSADSLAEVREGAVSGMDACTGSTHSLAGVIAPRVEVRGGRIDGAPPIDARAPPARPLDDPLAPAVVAAIRDIAPTGTGTAEPGSVGGTCVPDTWNWGAIAPLHPCHEHLPLVGADGDLVLHGGEGRGILVVDGDLELQGPFDFHGLVLSTGRLVVGDDVQIRGAARARHMVIDGGVVNLDSCAARAVIAASAFQIPLRPASRWWVPPF